MVEDLLPALCVYSWCLGDIFIKCPTCLLLLLVLLLKVSAVPVDLFLFLFLLLVVGAVPGDLLLLLFLFLLLSDKDVQLLLLHVVFAPSGLLPLLGLLLLL